MLSCIWWSTTTKFTVIWPDIYEQVGLFRPRRLAAITRKARRTRFIFLRCIFSRKKTTLSDHCPFARRLAGRPTLTKQDGPNAGTVIAPFPAEKFKFARRDQMRTI